MRWVASAGNELLSCTVSTAGVRHTQLLCWTFLSNLQHLKCRCRCAYSSLPSCTSSAAAATQAHGIANFVRKAAAVGKASGYCKALRHTGCSARGWAQVPPVLLPHLAPSPGRPPASASPPLPHQL